MRENEGQFNDLRFWFDLDAPCGEDSTGNPFEEDNAIEQVDDRETADTEELEDLGYIADIELIPRLVDLVKNWYRGWGEKLFPPMKPM